MKGNFHARFLGGWGASNGPLATRPRLQLLPVFVFAAFQVKFGGTAKAAWRLSSGRYLLVTTQVSGSAVETAPIEALRLAVRLRGRAAEASTQVDTRR